MPYVPAATTTWRQRRVRVRPFLRRCVGTTVTAYVSSSCWVIRVTVVMGWITAPAFSARYR